MKQLDCGRLKGYLTAGGSFTHLNSGRFALLAEVGVRRASCLDHVWAIVSGLTQDCDEDGAAIRSVWNTTVYYCLVSPARVKGSALASLAGNTEGAAWDLLYKQCCRYNTTQQTGSLHIFSGLWLLWALHVRWGNSRKDDARWWSTVGRSYCERISHLCPFPTGREKKKLRLSSAKRCRCLLLHPTGKMN